MFKGRTGIFWRVLGFLGRGAQNPGEYLQIAMQIETDFEAASIDILDASDPSAIRLALKADNASDFKQWFCFRVRGAQGIASVFSIENAGEASFPGAWHNFRALASYNGEHWFRVPTEFDGHKLVIRHTPENHLITYAYHAPYPSDRMEGLLAEVQNSAHADIMTLGQSLDGRPVSLLIFGAPWNDMVESRRHIWIIAHQHPGETMAAYCVEGILQKLLERDDSVTAELLERAIVFVVPRMNPDGCARGNHRTNALGRDLNREWLDTALETSPEVYLVREAIAEMGVDLFLDIHGEESIPYVFAFGTEGNPDYTERIAWLEDVFCSALMEIDREFQREYGYDRDPPGQADLRLATEYVANRFDCLSMGLEMPFKDNANRPNEESGWSTERSRAFGRSVVEALLRCVDELR